MAQESELSPKSRENEFPIEEIFQLQVDSRGMEAVLTLKPLMLRGRSISIHNILDFLFGRGLSQDRIDNQSINQGLKELQERVEKAELGIMKFPVAKGLPPVQGEDGWLRFDQPKPERVKIRADGSADYRNIEKYVKVKQGDRVASLFEGIPGKQGFDVYGKMVPPAPIKRPKLTVGENIVEKEKEEDGKIIHEYFSNSNGIIYSTSNSITISPELRIEGNVGLSTGNIDYEGHVIVNGSIEAGASVRCNGSLIVKENCESSHLFVAQDLEVEGGIKGGTDRSAIRVGGNISAKFVENANVELEGDLVVEGFILNSTIHCLGTVVMTGPNAQFVASELVGFQGLSCAQIGSTAEQDVHLELGFHFKNDRLAAEAHRRVDAMEKEMEELVPKIRKIKEMVVRSRGKLPPEKKEAFKRAFDEYNHKVKYLDSLKNKMEQLRLSRYNPESVLLVVRKMAYPGTVIRYRRQVEKITKNQSAFMMTFRPNQDKAIMVAYKPGDRT